MKKIEELSFHQVVEIIKCYYARYGRSVNDFTYIPKIEDGMIIGVEVYKNTNE